MTDSEIVQAHLPCDDCGSSDALALYSDGHTFCHSCHKLTKGDGEYVTQTSETSSELHKVSFSDLAKRGLTLDTCRFWSYGKTTGHDGKSVHVAQYLDDNRKVVAQKLRTRDKQFPWKNRKSFTGLYGQWLWRDGGKMVTITEGEIDALSVSQAQNNKWPVASLPDGAGAAAKAIKEALPWLQKFDKIVLFFDNDQPGRDAVDVAKKLLPPGKCFIAFTPEGFKDPNDLLVAGRSKAIIDAIYGAKVYRPDGIVSGVDVMKRIRNRPVETSYPFPDYMDILNQKTGGGLRLSELSTWTSGTGMGKTTIIKALQYHFFETTDLNQALIHLEEPLEDTADDLISFDVGRRFQVEQASDFRDTDEFNVAAKKLFEAEDTEGNNRFQLYDAFGSLEEDNLYDIIRYMAVSLGCKIVWLDHLSILVSEAPGDDERKRIDSIMHNLKSLTIELGIHIGLISHLRKPSGNGKSFEEGAVPSLDDLRGSGGIKQLSNNVFAISRDQQAESASARNTSALTVLKCRKTGRTGAADFLMFSDETGRLTKGLDPTLEAFDDNSSAPSDY